MILSESCDESKLYDDDALNNIDPTNDLGKHVAFTPNYTHMNVYVSTTNEILTC